MKQPLSMQYELEARAIIYLSTYQSSLLHEMTNILTFFYSYTRKVTKCTDSKKGLTEAKTIKIYRNMGYWTSLYKLLVVATSLMSALR